MCTENVYTWKQIPKYRHHCNRSMRILFERVSSFTLCACSDRREPFCTSTLLANSARVRVILIRSQILCDNWPTICHIWLQIENHLGRLARRIKNYVVAALSVSFVLIDVVCEQCEKPILHHVPWHFYKYSGFIDSVLSFLKCWDLLSRFTSSCPSDKITVWIISIDEGRTGGF